MEETSTMRKTFCFASGELCHLTDEQIDKVPYLSALVSAAEGIPSIRNDFGFYKLDSRIQSFHFAFVLKSFSFVGVRQIFAHLPKSIDVLTIIDLYEFLGLTLTDEPTFEEIDLTFFSTKIYKPSTRKYIEKIRVFKLQDMAVRFAVALAHESYDETNPDVIDQIYWFVMFILSAYDYFGPRLRHHVHRIAEYYFTVFSPTHLEPLARVMSQVNKGQITILDSLSEDFGFFEEQKPVVHQDNLVPYLERPLVVVKLKQTEKQIHRSYGFLNYFDPQPLLFGGFREWSLTGIEKHLQPIYTRVTNIIYERLQYHINKRLIKSFDSNLDTLPSTLNMRSIFRSLFHDPLVINDMDKEIVREIRQIMPVLREGHEELVNKLRKYDPMHQHPDHLQNDEHPWFALNTNVLFERYQEDALQYVCLFEQLDQQWPLEQIHRRIIDRLYTAVEEQTRSWRQNHRMILAIKQP